MPECVRCVVCVCVKWFFFLRIFVGARGLTRESSWKCVSVCASVCVRVVELIAWGAFDCECEMSENIQQKKPTIHLWHRVLHYTTRILRGLFSDKYTHFCDGSINATHCVYICVCCCPFWKSFPKKTFPVSCGSSQYFF